MTVRQGLQTALLFLSLIISLPFFFIGGPDWQATPLIKQLWNGGHIAFFAIGLFLLQQFKPLKNLTQGAILFTALLLLSFIIEYVQGFLGREFSLLDIYRNLAGAAMGLVWGHKSILPNTSVTKTRLLKSAWPLRALIIVPITPYLFGLTQSVQLQWQSQQQFPLISSFEHNSEHLRLSGNYSFSSDLVSHGQRSMKIALDTGNYSTVSIDNLLGDWRAFETLSMDLYNPDPTPLKLTLRIADKTHEQGTQAFNDRFNKTLLLSTGWNHINVSIQEIASAPVSRSLELDKLTSMAIFSHQLSTPRIVYWDNIQLH